MSDILAPEDEGFFAWLSRPRRAVLNVARGDTDAAIDQALDFVFNIPDAVIPGDAIKEFSGPESDIEVGDLLGMKEGWGKTAVDTAAGAAVDPLTYFPIGRAASVAAQGIKTAAKVIPGAEKAMRTGRNLIADTMNWHTLTPAQRAIETQAKATGAMAARASETEAKRIVAGLEPPEQEAIFDAIQNVTIDPATNQARRLTTRVGGVQPLADNQAEAILSLQQTEAWKLATPQRRSIMEQATRDAVALGQTQADEFLAGAQMGPRQPGQAGLGASAGPYLQRTFDFDDMASPVVRPGSGAAQATRARSLASDVELEQALNADPALAQAYQRDLPAALLRRAEQQGKIATRKTIGDNIYGKNFDITNAQHRADVIKKLDEMVEKDPNARDFAVRAKTLFVGMKPLDPVTDALAKFNANIFKPAATVGVVVPRVSFTVRNSLSSIAQALSTPGARGAALRDPAWMAQRVVGGILDPIDEAVAMATKGNKRLISDSTNELLARVDEAFAQSKGSVEKAKAYLSAGAGGKPMAKEALEALNQNVLENPIKVDEVLAELRPDAPAWQKFSKGVWDIPSKLNKHVEDRIRAGLFAAGLKSGQSPAAAAASVRNGVLDYSVPTIENRRMRTWIPFGAFMSQTLPQSARLLMENVPEGFARGGVGGAISSGIAGGTARNAATQMFESDPENPIYPDMEGKMAIDLGDTPEGRARYLTSFGLPLEGLGDLPQSFDQRELERFIGVAANPLAKTAYSMVSGREPFFGTPYGGYDRPNAALEQAGLEKGPTAALIRQVLGTGIAQPATHVLNLAEPWLDERQGAGLDTLRAATGVRVRDVDEDMALRLQLEEALRQNPRIKQYAGLYSDSDDQDTQRLLDEYNETKRRLREKREAAKQQAANVQ